MKKILLILIFTIGINFSYAQTNNDWASKFETTEKEYNFLTKGLRIQKDSGLDIIDGYKLVPFNEYKANNYIFNLQKLVNTAGDFRAYSLIITSRVSGTTYYLCIPRGQSSNLYHRYYNDIEKFDMPLKNQFVYFLSFNLPK